MKAVFQFLKDTQVWYLRFLPITSGYFHNVHAILIKCFTMQIPDNPPDYKKYYRHMNKVGLGP